MQIVQSADVDYESINELLVMKLPVLRAKYDELLLWWGDEKPGPHVVYGDLLNPFIKQAVRDGDASALVEIFKFVEVLSASSDARVRDVVGGTICDFIVADSSVFKRTRVAMGPLTKSKCEEVSKSRLT